jgi:hypothetical protein
MLGNTVKVDTETYAKLREIVTETSEPMIVILAKAVEAYRRSTFLEGLNADFATLRKDRRAWAEEQSERTAWDATMADDLQGN